MHLLVCNVGTFLLRINLFWGLRRRLLINGRLNLNGILLISWLLSCGCSLLISWYLRLRLRHLVTLYIHLCLDLRLIVLSRLMGLRYWLIGLAKVLSLDVGHRLGLNDAGTFVRLNWSLLSINLRHPVSGIVVVITTTKVRTWVGPFSWFYLVTAWDTDLIRTSGLLETHQVTISRIDCSFGWFGRFLLIWALNFV